MKLEYNISASKQTFVNAQLNFTALLCTWVFVITLAMLDKDFDEAGLADTERSVWCLKQNLPNLSGNMLQEI